MIHIVTAAPSTTGKDYGNEVIAVNRGIIGRNALHWVAGDTFTVEWCLEKGITLYGCLWTMKNEKPTPAKFPLLGRFDLLPGWAEMPGGHANWSIQGAIAVAVHLGYRWIVIHGTEAYFDKVEKTADATGFSGEQADRSDERWKRERHDLDLSIAWAQRHGATVYLDRT